MIIPGTHTKERAMAPYIALAVTTALAGTALALAVRDAHRYEADLRARLNRITED